ncbi:MAG TPA: lanthionine synthetase C family protein [Thermoanaerobaculia bacterium]|nr:lanthionine synthetase C family protein [Thermoanaerobaculia bacterium]
MSSQDTASSWSPILAPDAAASVLRVVEEIAADLRASLDQPRLQEPTWHRRGPSLAGGDAGVACFFTYLDQVRPGQGYDDLAMHLLERAIEGTGVMQAPPGLYSGFSGVAWALEHLRGRVFEEDPGDDPGEEVASALVEHLAITPWLGQYDLISGLVGFGVYALERLPYPGGRECLERTVARLAETSERQAGGLVTWRTGPELLIERELVSFPDGNFNLGVAHGVPGVIGVLARACAAGVDARDLLDGTVAWLLAQKLPPEESAVFSYTIAPGVAPRATRLAWCYGDLGIAATLLMAARAVGKPEWEREAIGIAVAAAGRDVETAGVVDAGICHGAAGAAHLFNRLFQATGEPALRAAALTWVEKTLAYRKPGEGVGGYQMWVVGEGEDLDWRSDPGFLTGSGGVGLALLAAATAVEPVWDRLLLSDVAPRQV